MNLHMPQDEEAEIELSNLAAIPTQIISPANNKSIIGIFQDSLLGCYTFTDKYKDFDSRFAMNLLMGINNINMILIGQGIILIGYSHDMVVLLSKIQSLLSTIPGRDPLFFFSRPRGPLSTIPGRGLFVVHILA